MPPKQYVNHRFYLKAPIHRRFPASQHQWFIFENKNLGIAKGLKHVFHITSIDWKTTLVPLQLQPKAPRSEIHSWRVGRVVRNSRCETPMVEDGGRQGLPEMWFQAAMEVLIFWGCSGWNYWRIPLLGWWFLWYWASFLCHSPGISPNVARRFAGTLTTNDGDGPVRNVG